MSMRRNAKKRIDHKRATRQRWNEGAGGIGSVACTRQKGRMLPQTLTHDVREKDDGQRVHRESVDCLLMLSNTAPASTLCCHTGMTVRCSVVILPLIDSDSERLPIEWTKRDRHNTELYAFIWMCFKLELLYWRDRL